MSHLPGSAEGVRGEARRVGAEGAAKAQYIMIGGFLGAGKTTAILKIAEQLRGRGKRVGLITNDQSFGLVDTTMLASHGFAVEEITGGCFCCKFNSLVEASEKLSAETMPEVFIAEPVGSCTDLKATVDYPLRRMYGADFAIAPLSVMVDPVRAMRILKLEAGKNFSAKVTYIYGKQLEEAEIIIINKTDLLRPEQLTRLQGEMGRRYPQAEVLAISAREGKGLEDWIERMTLGAARTTGSMPVDYDTYAEGEALLGWLNATVRLEAGKGFDGNLALVNLARRIQARLGGAGAEVAHLKMTLMAEEGGNDIAVMNLVRTEGAAELSHRLQEELETGELILNLRAEADPGMLRRVVEECLGEFAEEGLGGQIVHLESFRPGRPEPTHRLAGI